MYENKVKWCPICNQGWVEIVKDISTETLFCCCSECESEWNTPFNIEKKLVIWRINLGLLKTQTMTKLRSWDGISIF